MFLEILCFMDLSFSFLFSLKLLSPLFVKKVVLGRKSYSVVIIVDLVARDKIPRIKVRFSLFKEEYRNIVGLVPI